MKRARIYVDQRRNQIMEMLQKNPQVRVEDLANHLNVSKITVRRDLQYLEENGIASRFYGGAKATEETDEQMDEREMYRQLIAKYAATLVEDGDTLFINTSSTALKMVQYIERQNVTVITNNGKAIHQDRGGGVSIILTGGELRNPKEAMVGDFAVRNLQSIFAKKAFVGCSGISAQVGMTTDIANEVIVNHLMIQNATKDVYILADHTKLGKNCSFISCGTDMIKHLITDEKASQEEIELLEAQGITVHQVKKGDF